MGLDALFSQYQPTGIVGGMFSGMNQGASLADKYSTIQNRDQQTLRDQQMLPIDLAKGGAEVDQLTMANDKTRAIQSPEYLKQEGANALSESKFKGMTLDQAAKEFPFDSFISYQNKASQTQVQMLQGISTAIRSGQIDQAYQQLLPMMKDQQQRAFLDQEYKKAKINPTKALAELDKNIYSITNTMNQANLPQQQQRWLALLEALTKKESAGISASAGKEKPNLQSEIVMLERAIAQLPDGATQKADLLNRRNRLISILNKDQIKSEQVGPTTFSESKRSIFDDLQKPSSELNLPPNATFVK